MVLFCSDLDNTLIYSYRRDIGRKKVTAEWYQGREISFMTEKSHELIRRVGERVNLVPVTTRTEEQYRRIDLGIGAQYALICNGGVLLVNGREDESWYRESLRLTDGCGEELKKAKDCLEADEKRTLNVRDIRGLFLFTKSAEPEALAARLRRVLDQERTDVFINGQKVYVLPKMLNKGTAVDRLRRRLQADKVIAAGDSEFDVPMLLRADAAFAPEALAKNFALGEKITAVGEREIFSDVVLEHIIAG